MEIYFNDKLINEDYYTELSTNFTLFGDTFYLGSTASNTYSISIAKEAITTHPNTVLVKDHGTLIATLVVDKVEENDFEYKYTLTDKMVNLEFNYDASEIFNNGGTTLLEIAQDICNKAGIELATMDFRCFDKKISWYDNTRTAREYIGYIAELNGGYAQIGKDGRLYFIKQNTPSVKTISIDDCSDFKIGEKHVITRVVYEQGTLKYEYGDETGNTLYLSEDNVYITEQIEVEEIFNEINGFEFYSFSTSNCPIDYNIMAGQIITFTDGANNYPTIVGYELTYNGDWYGGYNLDVATKKQEETQVTGTSEKIRNLAIKVDRESNKITQAIKEIDDQNQKISVVEQTVNELNSKISDIADITTSKESTNGMVSFEKINQSEPIYVKIYPTGENISYLYPRANLFPSETLFMTVRTLRFTNTTTNEIFDYELPTDLLYYDAENYDEFILDYDAQSCEVNKRVGYNADGTTYVLDTPQTIKYEYPRILLTDGDYTVELLGYNSAYLFVRLMAQNMYTTQWATKAELNSEIKQTVQEVDIGVDKKLSNYSTTTQMNAAINVKANQITESVAATYATQDALSTEKSERTQTAIEIKQEVSKKVGNDEVISKINQSAEAVGINADKINLSANDVLNLLAGNTINLSGKKIKISSDNFTVDENGNLWANLATLNNVVINNGKINIATSSGSKDAFNIVNESNSSEKSTVRPTRIETNGTNGYTYIIAAGSTSDSSGFICSDNNGYATFKPGLIRNGPLYNDTSSSSANLIIDSAGQFHRSTNTSSKRYKTDITKEFIEELNPERLYDLPIKQFKYKEKYQPNQNDVRYNKHLIGFIAEELAEIYPIAVDYENGKIESWNERYMIPAMLKLIQKQHKDMQQLQNEILQLKGEK